MPSHVALRLISKASPRRSLSIALLSLRAPYPCLNERVLTRLLANHQELISSTYPMPPVSPNHYSHLFRISANSSGEAQSASHSRIGAGTSFEEDR